MSPRAPLALLAAAVLGCADPDRGSLRDRHDLYLLPPDRAGSVSLDDTEAEVEEKMGRPSTGFRQTIRGNRWTQWTYSRRTTDWQPYEDPDYGRTLVTNEPVDRVVDDVRLTFLNGRLRAIENLASGTTETNLIGPPRDEFEAISAGEEP